MDITMEQIKELENEIATIKKAMNFPKMGNPIPVPPVRQVAGGVIFKYPNGKPVEYRSKSCREFTLFGFKVKVFKRK